MAKKLLSFSPWKTDPLLTGRDKFPVWVEVDPRDRPLRVPPEEGPVLRPDQPGRVHPPQGQAAVRLTHGQKWKRVHVCCQERQTFPTKGIVDTFYPPLKKETLKRDLVTKKKIKLSKIQYVKPVHPDAGRRNSFRTFCFLRSTTRTT